MKKLKAFIREFSGDTETPITLFYKYVGNEPGFLLESRGSGKTNISLMGKNPFAVLEGSSSLVIKEGDKTRVYEGRLLDGVREYMSGFELEDDMGFDFMGGAVGTIGYDIIRQYEDIPDKNREVVGIPTVHLMLFKDFVIYDHLHDRIKLVALEETDKGEDARARLDVMEAAIKSAVPESRYAINSIKCTGFTPNMTKEHYISIVERAKKYIYDGDIFQVVLSQRLTAHTQSDAIDLYRSLRAINPSPYLFYLNYGSYQVAGSSPEMFVEVNKNRVRTCL